jgi:hypothetical protein
MPDDQKPRELNARMKSLPQNCKPTLRGHQATLSPAKLAFYGNFGSCDVAGTIVVERGMIGGHLGRYLYKRYIFTSYDRNLS